MLSRGPARDICVALRPAAPAQDPLRGNALFQRGVGALDEGKIFNRASFNSFASHGDLTSTDKYQKATDGGVFPKTFLSVLQCNPPAPLIPCDNSSRVSITKRLSIVKCEVTFGTGGCTYESGNNLDWLAVDFAAFLIGRDVDYVRDFIQSAKKKGGGYQMERPLPVKIASLEHIAESSTNARIEGIAYVIKSFIERECEVLPIVTGQGGNVGRAASVSVFEKALAQEFKLFPAFNFGGGNGIKAPCTWISKAMECPIFQEDKLILGYSKTKTSIAGQDENGRATSKTITHWAKDEMMICMKIP